MSTPAASEPAERSTPRPRRAIDLPASNRRRRQAAPLADKTSELAHVLASGDPRTWITLQARHVPGRDGRCKECRSTRQPAERWPCTLRTIADRAADLAHSPRATTALSPSDRDGDGDLHDDH
jgi:hypothetical protein